MSTPPPAPDKPVAVSARWSQLVGGILVLGFLGLVVYVIFIAPLSSGDYAIDPSLQAELDRRWAVDTMTELSYVALKVQLYACGHDGKLPPPDDWVNAIDPSGESAFVGEPSYARDERRIAMNIHLAGTTIDEVNNPDRTVLFFEARRGSPLAGGPELLKGRYQQIWQEDAYLIAYVNGSVEYIGKYKAGLSLVWDPRDSQDSPVVLQTPPPE